MEFFIQFICTKLELLLFIQAVIVNGGKAKLERQLILFAIFGQSISSAVKDKEVFKVDWLMNIKGGNLVENKAVVRKRNVLDNTLTQKDGRLFLSCSKPSHFFHYFRNLNVNWAFEKDV